MSEFISSNSASLIIFGISIVGLVIFLSIIFSDLSKNTESVVRSSLISTFVLSITFYLVIARVIVIATKNYNQEFEMLAFSYLIFVSIFIGLSLVSKLKEFSRISKKGFSLTESFKENSKENFGMVRDYSLLFSFPLISMYFLGNGSLNGLIILLFLAVLVVFISYTIIFPKTLKLFGKSSR
jgi:ACR3 family arsenite efflux pump ArsB